MKNILLFLLILSPFFATSQKMKYNKDVYPLIKEGKLEAFEKLKEYVQQDHKHSNATYWLAKYYDAFAIEYVSEQAAKLALESYKSCLNNTSLSDFGIFNAPRYPDAKGIESEKLYQSLKVFIGSRIKELDNLITSTANVASKKTIKVSSIKQLSEKLKIYFPEEIKNLTITDIEAEYSERTYNGKNAFNGPITIKGIDKSTDLIVTVGGNVDCRWLLSDYKKSEEEKDIDNVKEEPKNEIEFEGVLTDEIMGEYGTDITVNVTKGMLTGQQIVLVFHDGNYCEECENYYNEGNWKGDFDIGDDENIGRKVKGVYKEGKCFVGGADLAPDYDEESDTYIYFEDSETTCYRPIQLNYN